MEATSYAGITPYGETVLVRRAKSEEKIGSIIIPEVAKEQAEEGVVLAVGQGLPLRKCEVRQAPDVQVGDRVLFPWTAGEEYQHEGETLLLIWERHIQAVIEE